MERVLEFTSQILVIILILHAAAYSYKIAKWSCARSVQWLTAGFVYILVWRVFYTIIQQHQSFSLAGIVERHQTYFILPAYAMWAWGIYLLYKTLMNLGRSNDA